MKIDQQSLFIFPMIASFVLSFTFRGFARAFVANWLGDQTAKDYGFLTLNPAAHTSAGVTVFMTMMMVVFTLMRLSLNTLLICMLGMFFFFRPMWSVEAPINGYNFKNPEKGLAYVGLAGIAGNFILAVFVLYLGRLLFFIPSLTATVKMGIMLFVMHSAYLATWIGLLGFLPFPNTDGFYIFQYYFPNAAESIERLLTPENTFLVVIILIACLNIPILSLPFQLAHAGIFWLLSQLVFI